MKKKTRLMALLLCVLVLFQPAAFAETSAVINTNAVTEEVYDGLVQAAATYAAEGDYNKYLDSNSYPVYVTVNRGSSGVNGIPSEPAYYPTNNYQFFSNSVRNGGYTTSSMGKFSNSSTSIISADIIKHFGFIPSLTDDNVYGLADQTGVATIAMLPGIDFGLLLQGVANHNATYYDSDGEIVEKTNIQNYKVIPYVIKIQDQGSRSSDGWHIDCILVKKGVILAYDLNLPDGVQITDSAKIAAPFAETYVFQNGETSHAFEVKDVTNIGRDNAIDVSLGDKEYTAYFKGWNTEPDGSGDMLRPSERYTISTDTTLYAIWEFDPGLGRGDLLVRKNVVDSEGNAVTDDSTRFSFRLNLPSDDTEEHTYTKYYANNVAFESGTIRGGGSFELLNGQFVIIDNLFPKTDDAELTESDEKHEGWATVIENEVEGYTTTWKSGNVDGNSTTVDVQDALVTSVICENKAAPTTTTVTLKKMVTGNMGDRNKEFVFTVTDEAGNNLDEATYMLKHGETAIIENVPIGAQIVITEEASGYETSYAPDTYSVNAKEESEIGGVAKYTISGDGAYIVCTNNKNETVDTGILLDSLPYVLILVLVGGGVALWLANRRRRRED